jgi:WD40 repeat protein
VTFSPDEAIFVDASRSNMVRMWDIASGTLVEGLTGHDDVIWDVDISRHGMLATASSDATVGLWDFGERRRLATLTGHRGTVTCATFTPDGRVLGSAGVDGTVRLWDGATGSAIGAVTVAESPVRALAFAEYPAMFATGGDDGIVRLFDSHTRQPTRVLRGHAGTVFAVAFNPVRANRLASAGADGTVRLWDIGGDTTGVTTLHTPGGWAICLAYSPLANHVVSGGQDRMSRVWHLGGRCLVAYTQIHTDWVRRVCFSRSGKRLATTGDDGAVYLFDGGLPDWRKPKEVRADLAVKGVRTDDEPKPITPVELHPVIRLSFDGAPEHA